MHNKQWSLTFSIPYLSNFFCFVRYFSLLSPCNKGTHLFFNAWKDTLNEYWEVHIFYGKSLIRVADQRRVGRIMCFLRYSFRIFLMEYWGFIDKWVYTDCDKIEKKRFLECIKSNYMVTSNIRSIKWKKNVTGKSF